MSEPIKPALTPEEWAEALNSYGGDISTPPYSPDEKVEFYNSPRRLAAVCLYRQPFGFTREDVELVRNVEVVNDSGMYSLSSHDLARYRSLANRIEALLPPEKSA